MSLGLFLFLLVFWFSISVYRLHLVVNKQFFLKDCISIFFENDEFSFRFIYFTNTFNFCPLKRYAKKLIIFQKCFLLRPIVPTKQDFFHVAQTVVPIFD